MLRRPGWRRGHGAALLDLVCEIPLAAAQRITVGSVARRMPPSSGEALAAGAVGRERPGALRVDTGRPIGELVHEIGRRYRGCVAGDSGEPDWGPHAPTGDGPPQYGDVIRPGRVRRCPFSSPLTALRAPRSRSTGQPGRRPAQRPTAIGACRHPHADVAQQGYRRATRGGKRSGATNLGMRPASRATPRRPCGYGPRSTGRRSARWSI